MGSRTISAVKPPTIRELLDDPAYRRFMKQLPSPEPKAIGLPWFVYAQKGQLQWRGKGFVTYADAWPTFVKVVRNDAYVDVALVSKRVLYKMPPEIAHIMSWPFEWCPRCRRPTMYELFKRHHAMRGNIFASRAARCVFCAIKWDFAVTA